MESAANVFRKPKEELELKGASHSFSYCEASHTLFLCDSFHWTIELYNLSASGLCLSKVVELDQWLSNPSSVHFAPKLGAVFVGCDSDEGVYVFDLEFQLIKRFAQNMKMDFDCIAVNHEVNDEIEVYMSSVNSDKLTKWDYNTGSQMNVLSVKTPRNINLKDNKLYLICKVDSNACVLVIDKHSLDIVSTLAVSGFSMLGGLCIDESCNAIMSACSVVNGSKRRSICTVDFKGNLISQFMFEFDEHALVVDMAIVEHESIMLIQEPGPEFFIKRMGFK